MEEPSGLQNFLEIVTKPDNIPIVGMLILVIFFTWLGLREAFKNDKLIEEDAPAEQIAKSLNLIQTSDTGAIDGAIDDLIAKNPPPLVDFKNGKQAAMGALVGMIMKSAKGLNPKLVQERLRDRLK